MMNKASERENNFINEDAKGKKNNLRDYLYTVLYVLPIMIAGSAEGFTYLQSLFDPENMAASGQEFSAAVQALMIAGLFLGMLALSFGLSKLVTLSRWTKLVGVALVVAGMTGMLFSHTALCRMSIAALIMLLLVLLSDIVRVWNGRADESNVIFLAPFLALFFIVIFFMPISDKPLDWSGVVDAYERIVATTQDKFNKIPWGKLDYDNAEIGFDGSGTLISGMKNRNKKIMVVSGKYFNQGPTYIAGKIYTDFDGKSWSVVSVDYNPENIPDGCNYSYGDYGRNMDMLEYYACIQATYGMQSGVQTMLYRASDLKIKLVDVSSAFVFAPTKTMMSASNNVDYYIDGDNVYFKERAGYGYEYTVKNYIFNRRGEDLISFRCDIAEEDWNEAVKYINNYGYSKPTYSDLQNYRKFIYETYCPEINIDAEVEALLAEITATADTDYEKLLCIEAWLKAHEYTLEVEAPGNDIDSPEKFLHHFLLEDTKGYCSYYATAFVLMARAEGIPARYVQGYRISTTDAAEVTVISEMAHSWPEVYFEGIGWIAFEPTPNYSNTSEWGEPIKPEDFMEDSSKDEFGDVDNLHHEEEFEVPVFEEVISENDDEEDAQMKRKLQIAIIVAAVIVGTMVLVPMIIAGIRLIVLRVNFSKMNDRQKIIDLCERSLLVLECMGQKLMPGETLSEFAKRQETDIMFVDVYEEILYRKEPCKGRKESEILIEVIDDFNSLYSAMKKNSKASAEYLFKRIVGRKSI